MDRSPCKRAAVDLLNELSDCGNLATGIPPGAGYNYLGSAPVGAVNGTGVSVKEYGFGNYRTTVFTLSGVTMALTDVASTVAYTSQKIYDFPVGHIYIQSGWPTSLSRLMPLASTTTGMATSAWGPLRRTTTTLSPTLRTTSYRPRR